MRQGSMLEEAERILEAYGKEIAFRDLWAKVKFALEITPEEEPDRIAHFYTDLSMSGRFLITGENVWDLTSRHKYEDSHVDVSSIYSEVNEDSGDASDEADNKEYNQSVYGGVSSEGEEEGGSEEEDDNGPKESSEDIIY